MSNILIAAGFVLVAFIGSQIVQLGKRKKGNDGLGVSSLKSPSGAIEDDRSDLFRPRPSAMTGTASKPPRFDCPFEQIDLTIFEHVEWLKSTPNPELWHVATQAALAYTDDPHNFVPWVVEQKELARSTGGWIFLWSEGSLYLKGENNFYHSFSSDSYVNEVLSRLTSRSEAIGFGHDLIGLDVDFEKERRNCLQLIAEGGVATGRTVPHNLLDAPYLPARVIRGIDNVEGVVCL